MYGEVRYVDVYHTPRADGYDTDWSVSLCEADGGEITCHYIVGGDNDREDAWEYAVELADQHRVQARLLSSHTGEVIRTYDPKEEES